MSESKGEAPRLQPSGPLISRVNAAILGGIIVALIFVGSFWDLQISEALFDPTVLVDPTHANAFGVFGAAFGEVPLGLALVSAGALLITYRNQSKTWTMVLQLVGGVLLFLSGTVSIMYLPSRYLPLSLGVTAMIGAVIVAGTTWAVLKLASGVERRLAIRVAVVLFLVTIVELILVNIIKIGWERPRMRMLEEMAGEGVDGLGFNSWWQIGDAAKADATSTGLIEHEEFKSFPSGHTANSALLIMLTILPVLRPALAKWKSLLFWLGAAWAIMVAFSRIVMGAHFLTDTMFGLAVTFVTILVAYRIAFSPRKAELEVLPENPGFRTV